MTALVKLEYLRCPISGEQLEWLDEAQLTALRQAIQQESIVNRGGDLVTRLPEAVLACRVSGLGYPVVDGIPLLLPDEGVALSQIVQAQPHQSETSR